LVETLSTAAALSLLWWGAITSTLLSLMLRGSVAVRLLLELFQLAFHRIELLLQSFIVRLSRR
jgi:hypothetical protein